MVSDEEAHGGVALRQVARVFFTTDDRRLVKMRGLPLKNHLDNVALLAEQWDFARAFDGVKRDFLTEADARKAWLVAAARRHDLGKPRRFKIDIERDGKAMPSYTYSFRGHRFDVEDRHPYIQWLIRLHHIFSVDEITKAMAYLQTSETLSHAQVSEEERRHIEAAIPYFPLDLYALEMCDQIEAEATTHVFGQPEERQRVFMEFEVYPAKDNAVSRDDETRLQLFPYPFSANEVHFTVESFVVKVPPDISAADLVDGNQLKNVLLTGPAAISRNEVVLCPLE